MNPSWHDFLLAQGACIDNYHVADFGDPVAELAAARDATIVAPLPHLGLIECSGDDARSFLQNQLTSDVNHLEADAAQYSAWCSAKGRMLASFVLFRRDSAYLALLSADLQEAIQKRLQIYVLRSRVKIASRSDDHEIIGVSGPRAAEAVQAAGLAVPAGPMKTTTASASTVIRLDETRFIIVAGGEAAMGLWPGLATVARPAGSAAWQWLDVAAGIPRVAEATREAFVPQMAGFHRIGGVSFHKGCYPGQEVVARTQYLGKVKRHLYRVHAASPIAAGMPVHSGEAPDHPCGLIANAAPAPQGGYDALAVILEGSIGAGELRVTPTSDQSVALTEVTALDVQE